jgi:hypothetical protein
MNMLVPMETLRGNGATAAELGQIFTVARGLTMVGMLAGGAAALAIGPRLTAGVGALLGSVGCFSVLSGARSRRASTC